MTSIKEQRQHVSVSTRVFQTIEFDANDFGTTLSGFINRLLEQFPEQDECLADIEHAVRIKRQQYINDLSLDGEPLSDELTQVVNRITDKYRDKLQKKFTNLPKERSMKIRLNNENYRRMYPTDCDGISDDEINMIKADDPYWKNQLFYTAPLYYIKAILTDYASHSQAEREAIYFHDLVDQIQAEIDSPKHHLLRITNIESRGKKGHHLVKPYALMKDSEGDYNYLVCISKSLNPIYKGKAEFKPVSYRLSRIEKITQAAPSAGSGKITAKEEKLLKERIRDSGVGFLVSPAKEIKVYLSQEGQERYNSLSHLRPDKKNEEDGPDNHGKIITVFCSESQALIYFKPFGMEAKILEPKALQECLHRFYEDASGSYKT